MIGYYARKKLQTKKRKKTKKVVAKGVDSLLILNPEAWKEYF